MPDMQSKPEFRPVNNQTGWMGSVDVTKSGAALYIRAKAATEKDPLRRWIWQRLLKRLN